MKHGIIAAVLSLVVAGCGSSGTGDDGGGGGTAGKSGDAGAGACKANTPFGASVSWLQDGVSKCAVTVLAQRSSNTAADPTQELLQLQGVTLTAPASRSPSWRMARRWAGATRARAARTAASSARPGRRTPPSSPPRSRAT